MLQYLYIRLKYKETDFQCLHLGTWDHLGTNDNNSPFLLDTRL